MAGCAARRASTSLHVLSEVSTDRAAEALGSLLACRGRMCPLTDARPTASDATRAPAIHPVELAAIALLTLVAAWMRLRQLGALSLSGDEGFTFLAVRGVLHDGIPRLPSGAVYWKSLLYTYLASGAVSVVGLDSAHLEAALRLPAALASTALVPTLWWAARRMFTPAAGVAAAVVIALHVWQVEMSRYARYYPLLELTLVAFVERCHAVHVRRAAGARFGLVLCFLASLATHTIALTFLLLYVPILVFERRRVARDRALWLELGSLALVAIGWLAFESRWEVGFVRRPDGGAFGAVAALTNGLGRWSSQFFRWLPVLVPRMAGVVLAGGALWALLALSPRTRGTAGHGGRFAAALGATVAATIALLGFGEAHAVPRYLFFLLPFGAALAGRRAGGGRARGPVDAGARGAELGAWLGAALGTVVTLTDARVGESWRVAARTHSDRVEDGRYRPSIEVLFTWDTAGTGRYVAHHLAPGDRVLGTHPVFAYAYAGRLDGWMWWGTRQLWDAFHEAPDGRVVDNYVGAPLVRRLTDLTGLLDSPGRLWIVTTPSIREPTHVDPAIARFLAQHPENRVFAGRDGVSEVYRFDSRAGAAPRRVASFEIEALPGETGHAEDGAGASGGSVRAARAGTDAEGELASTRLTLVEAGRYAVTASFLGGDPGAGVLVQALRSRGQVVLAERFVRLPAHEALSLSLAFDLSAPDAIALRLVWDGVGAVIADQLSVVRDPPSTAVANLGHALTVACLGDSITATSGYPAVLETLLRARLPGPVRVRDLGRPGDNARQFLEAMSRDDVLSDADPDVALIQLGTNDARVDSDHETRDEFRANLVAIVERAKRFENLRGVHPRVALATLPPLRTARPPFGPGSAARIDAELNPTIREVARDEAVELIEASALYADANALSDGIHPTLATAERLAAAWGELVAGDRTGREVTD
ncbi:MAG: GDSL-type esterase/lipase family protein [bacterium]